MPRRLHTAPCTVCQRSLGTSKLSRVVIDGRTLLLCRDHAAVAAANMPRTFEELRALFPEPPVDGEHVGRRSMIERRIADDRRVFPPRPEGRRMGGGRRSTDQAA